MRVSVKLFAVARQIVGAACAEVELSPGGTVADLRDRLLADYPALAPLAKHLLFAVNSQYADSRTVIPADAEVACIPPVSGG